MTNAMAAPTADQLSTRSRFDPLLFLSRYGVIITLIGCVIFFSTQDDRFLSMANLRTTLAVGSPLLILALGLTVVLAMGDFDLSIAGMSSAAGAAIVVLIVNHGWGWGWAILVGFAFGLVAGAINGYLVAYIGTPSFITTLATGIVLAGVQVALTDNRFISGAADMADSYRDLGIGKPEPFTEFASPVWIAAGLAVLLWLFLAKTEIGRYMYAIGGNQEAARLAGIRVKFLRATGFVVVALTAVVAAIVETARTASTIPNSADSFLLPAFAAAFLGAAASTRNQFNVWGTVLGVVFLKVVDSGLTFMGYDQDVQNIAQGSILVGAMLLSRLGASRR